MSPRPRKASDEAIFAATHRIMNRLGPTQWTLADVGAEVGLTPGALVQRFGSKRQLLVALTAQLGDMAPEMFKSFRERHPSPLAALRSYADFLARMGDSPHGLAHHLAYLQLDFTDPDMHRHVKQHAVSTRREIRALLDDAVRAGELRAGTDTALVARAVEVTLAGSLINWGFYQDGPASQALRQDLDIALSPYLSANRP